MELDALTIRKLKAQLRRERLAERDGLPPSERMRRGERIAERLLAQPSVITAETLLIYLTFRSEAPTEPLIVVLSHMGKRLFVPHMIAGQRALIAAEYAPGDLLEPGPYGVPQPVSLHPLPSSELDVILAPGAVFDRSGGRMGYGKGYYDRFLADPAVRADVIGLAYDLQVVDRLPTEPHDRPMNGLATESGVAHFPTNHPADREVR